jgi:hypothetical protein
VPAASASASAASSASSCRTARGARASAPAAAGARNVGRAAPARRAEAGGEPVATGVGAPDVPVADIVLRVPDGRAFVEERSARLAHIAADLIRPELLAVEGRYVEVRDADGHVVTISAYAVRLGEGLGWTAPELGGDAPGEAY